MADKKPALYYALVQGYHPTLPGRIMAVTSVSERTDWNNRHMLYGRDEDSFSTTRRNERDVVYRFKDWAEVEAFEEECHKADEAAEEKYAQETEQHEFHRKAMMGFDGAMKEKRDMAWKGKQAALEALKEKARG